MAICHRIMCIQALRSPHRERSAIEITSARSFRNVLCFFTSMVVKARMNREKNCNALYLAVPEEGLLDERGENRIQHVPIQCIHSLIFTAAVGHDTCQERALSQTNKRWTGSRVWEGVMWKVSIHELYICFPSTEILMSLQLSSRRLYHLLHKILRQNIGKSAAHFLLNWNGSSHNQTSLAVETQELNHVFVLTQCYVLKGVSTYASCWSEGRILPGKNRC